MQHAAHQVSHTAFKLEGVHCLDCAEAVEAVLKTQPHITGIHLDWVNNVVHVSYHAGMIDKADIRRLIGTTGCQCTPAAHGEHIHAEATVPPAQGWAHLAHGVEAQPINMGTKHDRMQYEAPATAAHAHAHAQHDGSHGASDAHRASPTVHEQAHDHMSHDMSDPGMAAAIERAMRNKFWVALLLTIPTVLYSPLGMNLLGLRLPTFGLDMNVIMLLLSAPVVFYCGWLFIAGAYHSLRRGMLNMSVLIATGVLAAYLFSVLITVIGGETFFEAAAMLVTFVLFGHWMEMRSRRGTNEALRALFDLVPPQDYD